MKRLVPAALAITFTASAFGHGGGLDSNGCHTESATGSYHCHRPQNDGVGDVSASDEEDDLTPVYIGLGVASLAALIYLLVADERDRAYTFGPTMTVDDEDVSGLGLRFEYKF